jgi:alanyl-tRNA synthetase
LKGTFSDEDIQKVDELVNRTIEEKIPVQRKLVPLKQALETQGMVYLDNMVSALDNWRVTDVCFKDRFSKKKNIYIFFL